MQSLPIVAALVALVLSSFLYLRSRSPRRPPISPDSWFNFPLLKKFQVSPNTTIYRFKLPSSGDSLNLPIGQHVSISADLNGKLVVRNYTPISNNDDRGYFDLLIKTYEKGNISRHIAQLNIGDTIRVKGPKGQFNYAPGLVAHLSMIAGGTGITPMYQILRAVLSNPGDKTKISLIYANVNYDDILLRSNLDDLVQAHPDQFILYYVLNNPPAPWAGGVGFVTKDHIKQFLPNPAESNSKLLICGPPPMVAAMKKNLDDLGYPAPSTISKLEDKVFVF
ncbi:hypothetical protein APHAL10511_006239 [Amanita phalloides]|nr:hypothetical protein APHAL10511_006239 [Amanita phalloides]